VNDVKYSEKQWKEVFLLIASTTKLSESHLKKSASIQWAANKHINPTLCANMWLGLVTSFNTKRKHNEQ
jgi:hypothetical protein